MKIEKLSVVKKTETRFASTAVSFGDVDLTQLPPRREYQVEYEEQFAEIYGLGFRRVVQLAYPDDPYWEHVFPGEDDLCLSVAPSGQWILSSESGYETASFTLPENERAFLSWLERKVHEG